MRTAAALLADADPAKAAREWQRLARSLVAADPGLVFVRIRDHDGRVLAEHHRPAREPSSLPWVEQPFEVDTTTLTVPAPASSPPAAPATLRVRTGRDTRIAASAHWRAATEAAALAVGVLLAWSTLARLGPFAAGRLRRPRARTGGTWGDARRPAVMGAADRGLAGLIHDMRTPVYALAGFADLLRTADLPPHHIQHAEAIQTAARHIVELLERSGPGAPGDEPEAAPLDLDGLFATLYPLHAPTALARGVELIVVPPAIGERVHADRTRLTQVLNNLVGNAIRYSPHGRVTVTAETTPAASPSADLHIKVADTGPGIDPAERAHIFAAFTRGALGDRAPDGRGLGLAIVDELATAMGAEVGITSEPGAGSTFTVTLPACCPAGASAAPAPPRPAYTAYLITATSAGSVGWPDVLAAAGVRCVTAAAGTAAAGAAASQHADLTLVDIDASRLCERELPAADQRRCSPDQVVAAFVGPVDDHTHQCLVNAGYDAVVRKSADAVELRRAITAALEPGDTDRDQGRAARSPPLAVGADDLGALLVIDDEPLSRRLTAIYLEQRSTDVVAVASGEAGLRAACERSFDTILVDRHLPDIDGVDWIEHLRAAAPSHAATPVILLTGDERYRAQAASAAGAAAEQLVKPVSQDALLAAIERAQTPQAAANRPAADDARGQAGEPDFDQLLHTTLVEVRASIEDALAAGEVDRLYRTAHYLHGALAFCNEPDLLTTTRALERAACAFEPWAHLSRLAQELCAEIDRVLGDAARPSKKAGRRP